MQTLLLLLYFQHAPGRFAARNLHIQQVTPLQKQKHLNYGCRVLDTSHSAQTSQRYSCQEVIVKLEHSGHLRVEICQRCHPPSRHGVHIYFSRVFSIKYLVKDQGGTWHCRTCTPQSDLVQVLRQVLQIMRAASVPSMQQCLSATHAPALHDVALGE